MMTNTVEDRCEALAALIRTELAQLHEDLDYEVTRDSGKVRVKLINADSGSSFGLWIWADCVPHAALRTIMGALGGAWPRLAEKRE